MADLMLRIETLDLSLGHSIGRFARERRAEIDAHFEKLRQEKPAMWNGRVLLMHSFEVAESALRGDYFETDFASFVAWRDFGFPGPVGEERALRSVRCRARTAAMCWA